MHDDKIDKGGDFDRVSEEMDDKTEWTIGTVGWTPKEAFAMRMGGDPGFRNRVLNSMVVDSK
jgi:hypothetical protein